MNYKEDILNLGLLENLPDYTIFRRRTPGILSTPTIKYVNLTSWYFLIRNADIFICGIHDGIAIESKIFGVEDETIVYSQGNIYKLCGDFFGTKLPHPSFNPELLIFFKRGFPINWKKIVDDEIERFVKELENSVSVDLNFINNSAIKSEVFSRKPNIDAKEEETVKPEVAMNCIPKPKVFYKAKDASITETAKRTKKTEDERVTVSDFIQNNTIFRINKKDDTNTSFSTKQTILENGYREVNGFDANSKGQSPSLINKWENREIENLNEDSVKKNKQSSLLNNIELLSNMYEQDDSNKLDAKNVSLESIFNTPKNPLTKNVDEEESDLAIIKGIDFIRSEPFSTKREGGSKADKTILSDDQSFNHSTTFLEDKSLNTNSLLSGLIVEKQEEKSESFANTDESLLNTSRVRKSSSFFKNKETTPRSRSISNSAINETTIKDAINKNDQNIKDKIISGINEQEDEMIDDTIKFVKMVKPEVGSVEFEDRSIESINIKNEVESQDPVNVKDKNLSASGEMDPIQSSPLNRSLKAIYKNRVSLNSLISRKGNQGGNSTVKSANNALLSSKAPINENDSASLLSNNGLQLGENCDISKDSGFLSSMSLDVSENEEQRKSPQNTLSSRGKMLIKDEKDKSIIIEKDKSFVDLNVKSIVDENNKSNSNDKSIVVERKKSNLKKKSIVVEKDKSIVVEKKSMVKESNKSTVNSKNVSVIENDILPSITPNRRSSLKQSQHAKKQSIDDTLLSPEKIATHKGKDVKKSKSLPVESKTISSSFSENMESHEQKNYNKSESVLVSSKSIKSKPRKKRQRLTMPKSYK